MTESSPTKKPRRVGLLSQYWYDRGGTEVLARHLSEALQRAGDDVELLFLDVANRPAVERPGMPGTVVPITMWRAALDALRTWGADELVVLLDLRSGLLEPVGSYEGPFRTTLLVNANNVDRAAVDGDPQLGELIRTLLLQYDRIGVFFESSPAAKLLRQWQVPYGLSRIGIPPLDPPGTQDFRQQHGIATSEAVLLCVGLVAPFKFQVEMLRLLPPEPGRRIVFVGDIYTGTPDYGIAFGDAVLGRPDCLWLDGLPRAAVLDAMMASDLLLFPSQSEGAGLVLLEAMAVGLPWVCTPAVDLAPELEGGVITTLSELRPTVDALLASPVRRRALGEAGRTAQRERWTLDGTAASLRRWFAASDASPADGETAPEVIDAPWPATVQGDALFDAAAGVPPGCDWFVLANGPGMLAADTKAWLTTVMTEAHDAVILFRAPEPALPTEANIVAWLASGVAVFAVRVSWWRRQPVPAPSVKQTSAGWAAATVNRLTASARCYLGSIARET